MPSTPGSTRGKTRVGARRPYLSKLGYILLLSSSNVAIMILLGTGVVSRSGGRWGCADEQNDRNMVRSLDGQQMLHARAEARRRPGAHATLRPQVGPVDAQGGGKGGERGGDGSSGPRAGVYPWLAGKERKTREAQNLQGLGKGIQVPFHTLLRVIKGGFWGQVTSLQREFEPIRPQSKQNELTPEMEGWA